MSDLLWQKPGIAVDAQIQAFLAGDDVILDREFFLHDIAASAAHAEGLQHVGILTSDELAGLKRELNLLADDFRSGGFVLDGRFAPPDTGLLIPKTEDGRVLFILPWQGHALVGTTDSPAEIMEHPQAKEEEIAYVLRHINKYFDMGVTRQDVSSVWSGLRPLIQADPSASTAQLVREHLLMESNAGLISMAGGKWTSYRKMAEEAVDRAVKSFGLTHATPCRTEDLPIVGAEHFAPAARDALASELGLPGDVALHLHQTFGDEAGQVAALAHSGFEARLHAAHPYIEAEVLYATRHEYAQRAIDVITRRLPLALVDLSAAKSALPRVIDIMAKELGWNSERQRNEHYIAEQRLAVAL